MPISLLKTIQEQIRTLTFRPAGKRRRSRSISTEQLETRHMLAAVVELVADIDQSPGMPAVEFIQTQLELNGVTYFSYTTLADGNELWRTDGTFDGTYRLSDVSPGSDYTIIDSLTQVGNQVFFRGFDAYSRPSVWRSDGTIAGTQKVFGLTLDNTGSYVFDISSIGDLAIVATGFEPSQLQASDGTINGTRAFFSAPDNQRIFDISTTSNGRFYFKTSSNPGSPERYFLWTSDGTAAHTEMLTTTTAQWASIQDIVVTEGRAYFSVVTDLSKFELWTSDGTPSGTHRVNVNLPGNMLTDVDRLTVVGNAVFFFALDENGQESLWRTHGTDESATHVFAFSDSRLPNLRLGSEVEFQGLLFFVRNGQLWKSDGTLQGTIPQSIPEGSSFQSVQRLRDSLLLIGTDAEHGMELWTLNESSQQPHLLKDIQAGGGSSLILPYFISDGIRKSSYTVFYADDGINCTRVWGTDGTAGGTTMLASPYTRTASSMPGKLTNAGDELLFSTHPIGPGNNSLWSTDSTIGGVVPRGTGFRPKLVDGHVYYQVSPLDNSGRTILYQWNGDSGEPVAGVPDELDVSSPPIRLGDSDYFFGIIYDSARGYLTQLRRSSSSAAESVLVTEFQSVQYDKNLIDDHDQYLVKDDVLYFSAVDGGIARLWRSDGTESGTFSLSDRLLDGPTPRFALFGDKFAMSFSQQLVVSDGTIQGTFLVGGASPTDSIISPVGALPDAYMFHVTDVETSANSLWKTDGTKNGSTEIKKGLAVNANSSVRLGDTAFFFNYIPNVANTYYVAELWKSDGTPAGTQLVYAFAEQSISEQPPHVVGDKFIFSMLNLQASRREIWISDGTTEGTLPLRYDLDDQLVLHENAEFRLYDAGIAFQAATQDVGYELFRIDTTIAVQPPNNLVVASDAQQTRVEWPDVRGAIQYDVWLHSLSDQTKPASRFRANDPYFVVDTDLSVGTYRIWVRSLPVLGSPSAWSLAKDFVIGRDPVMHSIPAFTVNTKPEFSWTDAADAVSYEIWLTNRDTKTRTLHEKGLTDTTFGVMQPLPPARYAVWVRGTRTDGTMTDWSALTEFEILALPVQLTSGKGDSRIPRPTFMWAALTDATGYDVRVFAAGTSTLIYSANSVSGLTHTPLQDLPAGKFTVYVRALRGTRPLSAWSNGDALWLKLPPLNLRSTATGVAWDAVPFAASYTFELRDSRGALVVPRQSQAGTSFEPPIPLTPGQYSLRVFTNFSNLSSNWSSTYAFELFRPPVAITSSGAATVDATPTVTWTSAPGAATYELVVTRSGSALPVYVQTGITTTSHRIEIPLRNGVHEIQVRTNFADGSRSSWGPAQQLFIGPAAQLTYAAGKISWNAVNAATNYELWINYLGTTPQGKIVYQPLYVGNSYTLPSTLPKGRYQTWLRAIRAENGQLYAGAWTSVTFDFV